MTRSGGSVFSPAGTWAPLLTAIAVFAVLVAVLTPQPAGVFRDDGVHFAEPLRSNYGSEQRTAAVAFFPVGVREFRPLLVVLVGVIGVLGLVAIWPRARTLVRFLLGYTALIVVWPNAPDRFAWAVWPLGGVVLGTGSSAAWTIAASPA